MQWAVSASTWRFADLLPLVAALSWLGWQGRRGLRFPRGGIVLTLALALAVASAGRCPSPPADPAHVVALLGSATRSEHKYALTGRVLDVVRKPGGGLRVRVSLLTVEGETQRKVFGLVTVSVRHAAKGWKAGHVVRFESYLRRVTNLGNLDEFDWQAWNARRGVFVTAYLWTDETTEDLGPVDDTLSRFMRMRERLGASIESSAPGRGGALLRALVTGDRGSLTEADTRSIRDAGLSHMLAISGTHIGIVAGAVFVLTTVSSGFLGRTFAGHDPFRAAAAASMLAVLLYASISGGGVSVVRAVLMAGAWLLQVWRGVPGRPRIAWPLAVIVVTATVPGAVREASFQLSFAACAILICYAGHASAREPGRNPRLQRFVDVVAVSVLAWLVTAPMVAQHFGRLSLVGPLSNVLAGLPLFLALVVVLAGVLLSAISTAAASLLFTLAGVGAEAVMAVADLTASFPFSAVQVVAPGWPLVATLCAVPFVALVLSGTVRLRCLALLALSAALVLCHGALDRYRNDQLRVDFLAVGQGDATVVRLPGGTVIVVDAGTPGHGRLSVAPALRRMRVGRVDHLVVSHVQRDHWGGTPDLVASFDVGQVVYPSGPCPVDGFEDFLADSAEAGADLLAVSRAPLVLAAATDGSWTVEVLWPREPPSDCSENDASVVLRVTFAGSSVLLTGDIEGPAERSILSAYDSVSADVLKVAHHGSRTSSNADLIDAISPRFAVASLGFGNRYGMPHPEVRTLFESRGVRFYRTDLDGGVRGTLTDRGWQWTSGKGVDPRGG